LASWDVISWSYLFGDGSGSLFPYEKHIYQEYGNYIIKQIVTNAFGCSDTISQLVKILPEYRFWIPNAFTPDENLLNDYFMPIAIGVINYEFEIFNKWGEKLFSTKNPKQGWNGYFKGQECKQDVYVWRITFKNVVTEKDEVHYGHVSLLKNL
jgi:gliding motility-associated-like protein